MKDLHIHTKYSDGEYDEYEIVDKIKEAGITEFSICDHDTIEGSKKVYNLIENDKAIIYQSGVELSCRIKELYGGIDIHLLFRNFDYNDENLNSIVEEIAHLRKLKIQRMVDLVEKIYGIRLEQEEIKEKEKTTNSFGKPHIYALLRKRGAFDIETFYTKMRALEAADLKLSATEVLEMLKNSKGYVTLAHPKEIMDEYKLGYDDIDKIVAFLVSSGLEGLETRHSKHTNDDYLAFSKIAKKYNLVETLGSDYHGPNVKPHVKLGVCVKE